MWCYAWAGAWQDIALPCLRHAWPAACQVSPGAAADLHDNAVVVQVTCYEWLKRMSEKPA